MFREKKLVFRDCFITGNDSTEALVLKALAGVLSGNLQAKGKMPIDLVF